MSIAYLDGEYEVLVHTPDTSEEHGSVQYWFPDAGCPDVVKTYRTKAAALRFARAYAQRHQCGVEVLMESQLGDDVNTYRAVFYP